MVESSTLTKRGVMSELGVGRWNGGNAYFKRASVSWSYRIAGGTGSHRALGRSSSSL